MSTEDKNNKITEYRERHRFWAGQTLSQFGNANNFFMIISFAVIGYLIKEIDHFNDLYFTLTWNNIDFKATLHIIALIFAFLSVISGTFTVLSRLYDLRFTRHINTIRIKSYSTYDDKLPSDYIDIKKNMKLLKFHWKLLCMFWESIITDKYFFDNDDMKDENQRHDKFLQLRECTLMLGKYSWITFKWQILWMSLSVVFSLFAFN